MPAGSFPSGLGGNENMPVLSSPPFSTLATATNKNSQIALLKRVFITNFPTFSTPATTTNKNSQLGPSLNNQGLQSPVVYQQQQGLINNYPQQSINQNQNQNQPLQPGIQKVKLSTSHVKPKAATANAALTTTQLAQPKPDCLSKCGDLEIKFPFGTEAGCYLNEDFLITCENLSKPLLRKSQILVTNITMEGRLQVQSFVSENCYNETHMIKNSAALFRMGQFTISETQNKFTVIGCDSYGYIKGKIGEKNYSAGCISSCEKLVDVTNGSCSGFGCCQIDIPKDLKEITVQAKSFNRHKNVLQFNPCSYAFVIEDSQFHFSSSHLSGTITETVPTAIDWAITGQGKCEEAINNQSFACKENSTVIQVVPKDIFASARMVTAGIHTSLMVAKTSMNVVINKGIISAIDKPNVSTLKAVIGVNAPRGVGLSFVMLLVVSSWIYFMFQKRRLIKLKEKFFQQNGGHLLQQQLSKRSGTCDTARIFNAEELKKVTNNFDVKRIISRGAATPIIHRDVKSTNILLDDNFTAKVSDFGASKLVPMDVTQLSTMVQGTLGYLDPEYLHTSQLTEKSNVYSFGVVLVELMTGKKVLSFDRPEKERSLVMYFLFSLKFLFEILENGIVNDDNKEHMSEVAMLARRCLRVKGEERPTMKEVAMELEGLRRMDKHSWDNAQVNIEETEQLLSEKSYTCNYGDGSNSTAAYESMKDHALVAFDGGR
ncbi:hypothetical protein LWI29_021965 [Acer saccharum]|uniref:Protein kinase domain-containing protein n=1 Tax=Acer saccharum TaxID=4024 RepID=A0AA39VYL2_ACESA|nr:hypothetical protein LWI29_021965 [Acer saccharum]